MSRLGHGIRVRRLRLPTIRRRRGQKQEGPKEPAAGTSARNEAAQGMGAGWGVGSDGTRRPLSRNPVLFVLPTYRGRLAPKTPMEHTQSLSKGSAVERLRFPIHKASLSSQVQCQLGDRCRCQTASKTTILTSWGPGPSTFGHVSSPTVPCDAGPTLRSQLARTKGPPSAGAG